VYSPNAHFNKRLTTKKHFYMRKLLFIKTIILVATVFAATDSIWAIPETTTNNHTSTVSDNETTNTTITQKSKDIASKFLDIDYWGDIYKNGFENFIIRLGDCPHIGLTPQGNGSIYNFSVYNSKTNSEKPRPIAGKYTLYTGDYPVNMCMDKSESCLFVISDYVSANNYFLKKTKYSSGTLTIDDNGNDNYTLKASIVLENGEEVNITYSGSITSFRDKSFKGYKGPQLQKDISFTCDYVTSYTSLGDYFEMMDGGDPSEHGWFGRNRLAISLPAEGKVPPIGVFHLSTQEKKGSVLKGEYKLYGGGMYGPIGTYYSFIKEAGAEALHGFIIKGTIAISKDTFTDNYTIIIDCRTDLGYSIKAIYTGPFPTKK
jgi:hypothetical protein